MSDAATACGEFKLIDRLFKHAGGSNKAFTRLGIGDDASIHQPDAGMELVVSTDSSVSGVHWPVDFPLDLAADRAVCSALSDLAAMGAEPACVWLNVMAVDGYAVERLGQGATAALRRYDVELVGGDTSRSPINALSVTVAGQLPAGSAMRRDAANGDDRVWLCGRVGLHALGLQQWFDGQRDGDFIAHFESISPLLDAGMQLRQAGVSCCIDVSDGLLQDAGHLCRASGINMEIEMSSLQDWLYLCTQVGEQAALQSIACGGEDYALLFTAPAGFDFPGTLSKDLGLVQIGQCHAVKAGQHSDVQLRLHGKNIDMEKRGFDHFA
ncbi:thiamine-phosphate kinase [Mariprofundus ferrooxydans]|nr:thiamine-phosphate kinase [Mariprofundus ferrooxydans]